MPTVVLACGACEGEAGNSSENVREKLEPAVVPPLGITECDAYLARYEQCITASFPANLRTQALAGLKSNRDAWASLTQGDTFKKQALARVCDKARVEAATELSSYGCVWSDGDGSGGAGAGGSSAGGASSGGASSGGASSGGAGTGGSSGSTCTIASATDLGAPSTVRTVSNRACVKVQSGYPTWWDTRTMSLQVQSPGVYPAPYTWSNACTGASGSGTFTADWQTKILGSTSENCATLISLSGSGTGNIRVVYFGQ